MTALTVQPYWILCPLGEQTIPDRDGSTRTYFQKPLLYQEQPRIDTAHLIIQGVQVGRGRRYVSDIWISTNGIDGSSITLNNWKIVAEHLRTEDPRVREFGRAVFETLGLHPEQAQHLTDIIGDTFTTDIPLPWKPARAEERTGRTFTPIREGYTLQTERFTYTLDAQLEIQKINGTRINKPTLPCDAENNYQQHLAHAHETIAALLTLDEQETNTTRSTSPLVRETRTTPAVA